MSIKLALSAVALLVDCGLPADVHDIYLNLADSAGVSCCNEYDYRPAPYRVRPSGVQMFLYGV